MDIVSLKKLRNDFICHEEYKKLIFECKENGFLYVVRSWDDDDNIYIEKPGFFSDDFEKL